MKITAMTTSRDAASPRPRPAATGESAERGVAAGAWGSAPSFCFRIGNFPFSISGDAALIERVARYYRELPPPDESHGFELRWKGLEGTWGAADMAPLTVSCVADESVRPALTAFLVARLLSEAAPGHFPLNLPPRVWRHTPASRRCWRIACDIR